MSNQTIQLLLQLKKVLQSTVTWPPMTKNLWIWWLFMCFVYTLYLGQFFGSKILIPLKFAWSFDEIYIFSDDSVFERKNKSIVVYCLISLHFVCLLRASNTFSCNDISNTFDSLFYISDVKTLLLLPVACIAQFVVKSWSNMILMRFRVRRYCVARDSRRFEFLPLEELGNRL